MNEKREETESSMLPAVDSRAVERIKQFLPDEFTLADEMTDLPAMPRRLGQALEVGKGFYVFSKEGLDRLLRIDGLDTTEQKVELVVGPNQFETVKDRLHWAYSQFGLFNFFLYNNTNPGARSFTTYLHSAQDLVKTIEVVQRDVDEGRLPFKYGIAKGINIEKSRGHSGP
jgi:hypothetical protein